MKRWLAIMTALTVMVGATACTKQAATTPAASPEAAAGEEAPAEAEAPTGDSILIGGLAPLTGAVAVYGTTTTNGANLAFEEINANGGILGGKKVEYRVEDEKGEDAEAVNAYNRLSSSGIVALLGDVTSKPTIAVAGVANGEGMPMVTATATADAVTKVGDNVFRVCFIDPFQGVTMARFAYNNLGAKTAAVVYNTSDDYSDGIAKAFSAEAEKLGLTVVAYEGYGNDDIDFKTQLTNIAKDQPDVLMVPDYYSKAALIATQAKEVGLTSTLLGADGWDGVIQTVDAGSIDVLEGSYFCNHYSVMDQSEKVQNFIKSYTEKYGEAPSAFAALGYDAAYIIANAIEAAGSTDKAAILEAIANTNYEGVTGTMTFDADGNPIKSVSIIKIVNGEYTFDTSFMPE